MTDIADDGLPAFMNVHMLDPHGLLAAAPELRQRLRLGGEGSEQFVRQIAELPEVFDCFGTLSPTEHDHRSGMSCRHLHGEHGLGFVSRSYAVHRGQGGIDLSRRGAFPLARPNCIAEGQKRLFGKIVRRRPECVSDVRAPAGFIGVV